MVHAAAAATRGESTSPRRAMDIGAWAAGGALALAWIPALARAQEEGEGDVAVEEGGEEPNKNSSVAKAVEVR